LEMIQKVVEMNIACEFVERLLQGQMNMQSNLGFSGLTLLTQKQDYSNKHKTHFHKMIPITEEYLKTQVNMNDVFDILTFDAEQNLSGQLLLLFVTYIQGNL
ncbi:hypothetical protein ACJX0J_041795, partial [Zea mays]